MLTPFLLLLLWKPLSAKEWEEQGVKVKVTKSIPLDKCSRAFRRDLVHQFYTLKLDDGKLVHTNVGGEPFKFRLGLGEVIKGMDVAMRGMCEGEERSAIIPSDLGYGKDGNKAFNIPGGATLHFDITLAKVEEANKLWESNGVEMEITKEIPEEKCKMSEYGDTIEQFYTVKLEDGTLVDSNEGTNRPFIFKLGMGQVIKGMDIAMKRMCEGEKRRVVIPSDLGYGDDGSPPDVPGGATLYFNIELRKLIKAKEEL